MLDSLIHWAGVFVVIVLPSTVAVVVAALFLYLLIDFISKVIAMRSLIVEGRIELKDGYTPLKAACANAFDHLGEINYTMHSNNEWLRSLEYTHPFKWRIINHWDYVTDEEDDGEEK